LLAVGTYYLTKHVLIWLEGCAFLAVDRSPFVVSAVDEVVQSSPDYSGTVEPDEVSGR
jgi:hypothetical protein